MAAESSVAPRGDLSANPDQFENELPTYRAISALALTSAAAGLFSGLAFISWGWLFLSVIAVVAGFEADRRIRKMPDVLTGRAFAHAGLALGLIFGVTSIGYSEWKVYSMKTAAMKFASGFVESLNEAGERTPINTADAMWYMLPPGIAKGISPEEAHVKVAEMLKNSDKAQQYDMNMKQMLAYAGKGNPITLGEVEKLVESDGDTLVSVRLNVGDGRAPAKHEDHDHDHAADPDDGKAATAEGRKVQEIIGEGADHALILVHGVEAGHQFRWFVEQIRYPYQPKSFTPVATKKPVDDGHGHGH